MIYILYDFLLSKTGPTFGLPIEFRFNKDEAGI